VSRFGPTVLVYGQLSISFSSWHTIEVRPAEANERQPGAIIVKPESVSQLKFFYTNADSIVNKMSEFRARTADNVYDVIGIVESHGQLNI